MRSVPTCLLAALLLLNACATDTAAVHKSVAAAPQKALPRKVLLLPVDIDVHEISVGGVVEKVDAWSATASGHATAYLHELARGAGGFELIESPALDASQKAGLDQHVALYELVAGSAFAAQRSQYEAWRQRARDFDYTLGPGLAPLASSTGADAAMIVIGTDHISSSGRRAAMLMGMVLGTLAGAVVVPQGGTSFISVGVVDMRTGDLLWLDTEQGQVTDLREQVDVRRMLDLIFGTYPSKPPVTTPARGG